MLQRQPADGTFYRVGLSATSRQAATLIHERNAPPPGRDI